MRAKDMRAKDRPGHARVPPRACLSASLPLRGSAYCTLQVPYDSYCPFLVGPPQPARGRVTVFCLASAAAAASAAADSARELADAAAAAAAGGAAATAAAAAPAELVGCAACSVTQTRVCAACKSYQGVSEIRGWILGFKLQSLRACGVTAKPLGRLRRRRVSAIAALQAQLGSSVAPCLQAPP
jgi:hypothetical protein